LRLKPAKETDAASAASLYFHRRREAVVVATLARTRDGIYYAVPQSAVLLPWPTPETLGDAFRHAFSGFSVRNADLVELKKTD
jgi:hypothetical protein